MRCFEAIFELGRKRQKDSALLAGHKDSEVPVIFLEGESMSLSEKSTSASILDDLESR